jgi:DGQHR domain-containing protein
MVAEGNPMRFHVPAVRAVQNGQEIFTFFLPAETLIKLPVEVERFDPDKPYDAPDQGYQRRPENNRARRFARYLETPHATSPTALMLNDRDSVTRFDAKKGELIFDTDKGPIFNYDGQHRELGYEIRLDSDPSFGVFPIPVVMTRGMDKLAEMLQFRTINSTAKGVATSLVNAILAKYQTTEGDDVIQGTSVQRNVVAYKATEALNNDPSSPWYQLIVLPNQQHWTKKDIAEDPEREHTRIIRANSFVDALRPIYDYMTMLKIASTFDERAADIASVVGEFWNALKEKMSDAFDAPNEYALFRSGGVGPMHLVLRDLLIKMHTGHRKFVKQVFLVMIAGSELLADAEFWLSSNDEGARIYSGKANWPDLAKKIIRDIEEGVAA